MFGGERRFYFVLATRLGMTVSQLLANVSSRELTEWRAIYQIEHSERQHAASKRRAGIN